MASTTRLSHAGDRRARRHPRSAAGSRARTPIPRGQRLGAARDRRARSTQLEPASLEELFIYLVFHDAPAPERGQIRLGLWPRAARASSTAKTLRNYLSKLRRRRGRAPARRHRRGLPDRGRRLDWATFERLSREADTTRAATSAIALRTRGPGPRPRRPLRGRDRRLRVGRRRAALGTQMTVAIVHCAAPPRRRPPRGRALRERRGGCAAGSARGADDTTSSGSSGPGPSAPAGTAAALELWMARRQASTSTTRTSRAWTRSVSRSPGPLERRSERAKARRARFGPAALLAHRVVGTAEAAATSASGRPPCGSGRRSTDLASVSTPAATAAARRPGQRSRGSALGGGDVEVVGEGDELERAGRAHARTRGAARSRWPSTRPPMVRERRPARDPTTTSQATETRLGLGRRRARRPGAPEAGHARRARARAARGARARRSSSLGPPCEAPACGRSAPRLTADAASPKASPAAADASEERPELGDRLEVGAASARTVRCVRDVVMAPSRQTELHGSFLEASRDRVPAREILRRRSPWSWRLGTSSGTLSWDTRSGTRRAPRAARRPGRRPRGRA